MFSDDLFLTPSAARILSRCRLSDKQQKLDDIAGQLVLACLDEESLAGALLKNAGISPAMLQDAVSIHPSAPAVADSRDVSLKVDPDALPAPSIAFLNIAAGFAQQEIESNGISSEHLLAAVFEFDSPVRKILESHGLSADSIVASFGETQSAVSKPLPISVSFDLDDSDEQPVVDQAPRIVSHSPDRVLDACMNRAREGLRVLEDYARFVCNNIKVVERVKLLRHRLADSERQLATRTGSIQPSDVPLNARNVGADVGTQLTVDQELRRTGPDEIVHANARRVQESLRSLEEFGKLVSPKFAQEMKQLRYESYEIHQLMLADTGSQSHARAARRERLMSSRVCVLVTESGCRQPWMDVVRRCLDGNADVIQLREKSRDDSDLLDRASWLTETCHSAGALAVINDRPDVAVLSHADGVHVGQDDLAVRDVRRLIGNDMLIGLSTHSDDDIRLARQLDVDYLGVGPVYQSTTKDFDSLVGLELLRNATTCELPWFAIGGIQQSNLSDVIEAGGRRIAVSAAVIGADNPELAVVQLLDSLQQ